jgi:hypothetical protein
MKQLRHIFLLPKSGSALGLLAAGPCGAMPPMAYMYKGAWAPCKAPYAHSKGYEQVFVVLWEKEVVREGLDRIDWIHFDKTKSHATIPGRHRPFNQTPTPEGIDPESITDAQWWAWEKAWTFVHLDKYDATLVIVAWEK